MTISMMMGSAAALALSGALAQETPAVTGEDEDVITVRGFRLQAQESIEEKRRSALIADFLTADELGRQPDLNVADSLRRLPGVVTVFDEDEGRYVALRGLDQRYTFISFDGALIASTDRSDRDINIESIPPTAVKRLEVIKSLTPDLDGQSVGGVINLVTRSAFDADGFYLVANGQVGIHESIGDLPQSFDNPSYRFDGAISNLFANDTIGVFLSGTVFDKKRDQGRPILGYGSNDSGDFVNRVLPLDYANQIYRWNALGKIEFRPNDMVEASFLASRFDYQYDEDRYRFDLFEDASTLTQTGPLTGSFGESSGRVRFDRFPLGQTIDNLQGRLSVQATEKGLFEAGISYSRGVQGHPYNNAAWTIGANPGLGYSYDIGAENADEDEIARITLNDPSVLFDTSLYDFQNYCFCYFRNEEDVTEFFGDYAWNTEGPDAGLGFKVGVKYRNLEKNRYDESVRYSLADTSSDLDLGQFIDPGQTAPYTEEYLPGFNYPLINADLVEEFVFGNEGLFTTSDASNNNAFYNIQEDVTAFYGMLTYSKGRHSVRGGLRYERTEVLTQAALNGSALERVAREFEYDHVLPSVSYTFDISERMKLRAGYAQAIGRPNHPEVAGAETFDEANTTIRRANTSLKPRESDNFDLAFDFYIGNGEFFSAAIFHKDIENQISTIETQETIGGVLFDVFQPVNLDSVAVTGLELSFTDDRFDFLPAPFDGLGVVANLTLLDGEDGPADGGNLISQPDYLFNISGLYEYGPFQARLTYNESDDRPTSGTRAEQKYEQLDLQLRYQITDRWQGVFEGRNILNNPRQNIFTETGYLREINDFGNSWWVGVAYRY